MHLAQLDGFDCVAIVLILSVTAYMIVCRILEHRETMADVLTPEELDEEVKRPE